MVAEIKLDREPTAKLWAEGFRKGLEAMQRKNPSGCCCKFAEDGETILSLCKAHSLYFEKMKNKLRSD